MTQSIVVFFLYVSTCMACILIQNNICLRLIKSTSLDFQFTVHSSTRRANYVAITWSTNVDMDITGVVTINQLVQWQNCPLLAGVHRSQRSRNTGNIVQLFCIAETNRFYILATSTDELMTTL